MVYKTQTAAHTKRVAASLAKRLKLGDIVALYGELGSGKTTFVQGLAQALGIRETVNSPTFVVVKPYRKLVHADLYRMKSAADVHTTGLADFFGSPRHIVVIEWPELIEHLLPEKTKKIYFRAIDEQKREINIID